jgi:NTE family protein
VKWQKLGTAARAAHPESPAARFAVIRARIGEPAWPERDLRITAVDTDRGELVVFDRTSGVTLLEAVAASCAVPLVWPPVPINGTTYVDGGVRSAANADLAQGAGTVVVLAPTTMAVSREHALPRQLERTGAARTLVVSPDEAATKAMGRNALDPAHRQASAETGLRQGALVAAEVAAVWDETLRRPG